VGAAAVVESATAVGGMPTRVKKMGGHGGGFMKEE
jgi:hypothetical protein